MLVRIKLPANAATLAAALEGLVRINMWLLQRSQLPPLYRSGVQYARERVGEERWLTAEQVYAARVGDCEDLAAWRAAELRLAGEAAARAIATRTGERRWHAVVERADGTMEDPSARLGMGTP